jgi:DNA polymerase-3 subunit delta
MAVVKPNAIERLVSQPNLATRAFLVFGTDPGAVHDCAARIVTAAAGSTIDPFNVVHLGEEQLKADPALLADEAQAISMFGGQRVLWLRDVGPSSQKALLGYLEQALGDAIIVCECGNLTKSSALRKHFEDSKSAAAVPCYPDTGKDLHDLINRTLASHDLSIDMDVRALLITLLGEDRGVSIAELKKLALYCHGNKTVTVDDILAVCGDASALSIDGLVDAVFEGYADQALQDYAALIQQMTNPAPILSGLGRHISTLEGLRLQVEAGISADSAVRSARPPIFFKRQTPIARQLTLWKSADLKRARKSVFQATQKTRELPGLQIELCERCLLSLARSAQSARLK